MNSSCAHTVSTSRTNSEHYYFNNLPNHPYLSSVSVFRPPQRAVVSSTTANSHFFLQPILSLLTQAEALPAKDEVAKVCADEDADDDVSVVCLQAYHVSVHFPSRFARAEEYVQYMASSMMK